MDYFRAQEKAGMVKLVDRVPEPARKPGRTRK
jgi:hypothetical protein